MRRSLGFKLQEAGKGLLDFVTFMEQHRASYITQALALAWAQQPSNVQPAHWAQRLSFVRGFARHRSATDPRTQIPAPRPVAIPAEAGATVPVLGRRDPQPTAGRAAMPCRYERGAVATLDLPLPVRITERLGPASRRSAQSRASGRRSEGRGVDDPRRQVRQDATGAFACLDLQGARRLHRTTQASLGGSDRYPPICSFPAGAIGWMAADIHRTFYALSRQIGLRGASDSHGPRLHDMRHRFATNTLVRWYRSNQDPERRLPILSAYLGHVHVADTQWYLSGSPELMREAMRRLEQRWEDRP